ncbi:VanZ family protein [Arthrobacter ruber]|uniref:VanZ family protein n=1 Tax=Arthrobacter ruber TaxID=1258893 RepID=UPI00130012F6|nr:VanZ family protein [Arthrobacter ruber]
MAVALIVLWPTPVDRGGAEALRRALNFLHEHGLPTFVTYSVVEFSANILMFVPLGLFWFLLTPPRLRWWAPAVSFALSTLIEATQFLLLPQRFATPYDVVANTLGALVGALTACALLTAGRRERSP